jgi:hypothetical protein
MAFLPFLPITAGQPHDTLYEQDPEQGTREVDHHIPDTGAAIGKDLVDLVGDGVNEAKARGKYPGHPSLDGAFTGAATEVQKQAGGQKAQQSVLRKMRQLAQKMMCQERKNLQQTIQKGCAFLPRRLPRHQRIAENKALWSGETTSCDKMSHKNVTKCHIENKSIEYREKNISTNVDISEKSQKNFAEEVVVDLDDGFKDFSKRFIDEWNSIPELSTIRQLRPNSQRYKQFHARYTEVGGEELHQLIDKIKCSSFLRGENNRGWKVTLEWVMNPNNFDKVIEDKYTDRGKVVNNGTRGNGENAKVGETDDSALLGEIFGVDLS